MTTLTLSCDNFHGKLSAGMLSLLESEQLANVTIAVDGRFLKAHQMVLSICSSYFKTLLETNPCKHPIIFMKDVKYHIMKHLLRFMYEGEAQIDAEDFQIFIDTAQALQIKWLTTDEENTQKTMNTITQPTPLLLPEPSLSLPSTSKSTKRPFISELIKHDPVKTIKSVTNVEDPLQLQMPSTFTEQITKRPKILTDKPKPMGNESDVKASTSTSGSSSIGKPPLFNLDNASIGKPPLFNLDNEIMNVEAPETKEHLAPLALTEISTEGSTSGGVEGRYYTHPMDETRNIEDIESSYQDDISVKVENDEIIDIDEDDNDEEDELLEQLPDMSLPDMDAPDTSTSMQVSNLQEGEPVLVHFVKTPKGSNIVVQDHRYIPHYKAENWTTWRCARCPSGSGKGNHSKRYRNCTATVCLTFDNRIILKQAHNHPPSRLHPPPNGTRTVIYFLITAEYLKQLYPKKLQQQRETARKLRVEQTFKWKAI